MPGARAAGIAGLYAVTPDIADTALLVRKVDAAIRGGATVVQYRNKRADAALRLAQAGALARLPAMRDARLIVNDDAAVAAAVGADGVHLGEHSFPVDVARVVLPAATIGASVHEVTDAATSTADFVFFGPVFATPSKASFGDPQGTARLADAVRAAAAPVLAIGGITAANARVLFDAGADAVAVIADLFGHDSDEAIVRAAAAIVAENPARSTKSEQHMGTR